jgi:phospholipid/cholesterol/gamma-HCH transport system substrate-binding protein
MRFRIQYKDQIVGALSILGIAVLVFLVVFIGSNNRWFSKDYHYKTLLSSASGLAKNMAVTYKGFKIGAIESFFLNADSVEVQIAIYDTYIDYIKEGSVVDLLVSPIGLGNQFVFYPGLGGQQLPENTVIPVLGSPQAANLVKAGLANIPPASDSVSILLSRANTTLDKVNAILASVDQALVGTGATTLGRTILDIERILQNIETLSALFSAPESAPRQNLESSLSSLAGILSNIDRTTAAIPEDMPEVSAAVSQLRQSLASAQDVLTALSNNPLLKGGIPPRVKTEASGANPRDVPF